VYTNDYVVWACRDNNEYMLTKASIWIFPDRVQWARSHDKSHETESKIFGGIVYGDHRKFIMLRGR